MEQSKDYNSATSGQAWYRRIEEQPTFAPFKHCFADCATANEALGLSEEDMVKMGVDKDAAPLLRLLFQRVFLPTGLQVGNDINCGKNAVVDIQVELGLPSEEELKLLASQKSSPIVSRCTVIGCGVNAGNGSKVSIVVGACDGTLNL